MTDVEAVGGKNASLGEMISQLPTGPEGVRVPTGFATTAHAFRAFLAHDGLDTKINAVLDALDTEDVRASGGGRWPDPRLDERSLPGGFRASRARVCR
jgi:pyruvate,water dikinase